MRRYPTPKPQRDRTTQRRFRTTVLRNANHQCQYITTDGTRCPITHNLQAHHTTPTTGIALCRPHHRALDPHAR